MSENEGLKQRIFEQLSQNCTKDPILATNTSSISISRIAGWADNPGRVVGMHFFNPVPVMELLEVIPGLQTSDATLEATESLGIAMGKEIVVA